MDDFIPFDQVVDDTSSGATETIAPDFIPFDQVDETPAPQESWYDWAMGGTKGIAKAALDIPLAGADLLYRGGNAGLDYLTGTQTDPELLKQFYPSALIGQGINELSGNTGSQDAENVTHIAGNLGSALAIPSQGAKIAQQLPSLQKIPYIGEALAGLLGYGAEGAGLAALSDPKSKTLGDNITLGAAINPAFAGLGKGVSTLWDKFLPTSGAANRGATALAQDIMNEVRGEAPTAFSSTATKGENTLEIAKALEARGLQARSDAGKLFNEIPQGEVILDDATQNIINYAKAGIGPKQPGWDTQGIIGYLQRLKPEDIVEHTPAVTTKKILDASGRFEEKVITPASSKIIPGGPAKIPLTGENSAQSILRDIGASIKGSKGFDQAVYKKAFKEIKEAVKKSVPEDTYASFEKARAAWKNMDKTWQQGAVGKVRRISTDEATSLNTFKNKLLNDGKSAEQLVKVMTPKEINQAQNLVLGELFRMAPVSWEREITKRIDSYKALFGDGAHRLVDMVSREGTVGSKLLQDNHGLLSLLAKGSIRSSIGGTVGYYFGGTKGAIIGGLAGLGKSKADGMKINRAKALIARGAAGNAEALKILNTPLKGNNFSSAVGRLATVLNADTDKAYAKGDVVDRAINRAENKMESSKPPTHLVDKVIDAESSGRADAVGPETRTGEHAKGLMQLMDSTGAEWHDKLVAKGDLPKDSTYKPFDKEQNKKIGTAYLNHLLDKYNGNEAYALAAYNWGLGNLADWKAGKAVMPDETKKYVNKILGKTIFV